jgi:sporulation protein YlmC with PRC-barrel domain
VGVNNIVADFKGAEVYTLEGKHVGKIKEINANYFTTFNRGILTDEEFRIPMSAVSAVENRGDATIIRLSMKEEEVKHGYEFTKGKPNSEFASGAAESEPKIPLEKQVIHYESSQPAEASRIPDRPPAISEYLCDMCNEKFGSSSKLQEHRAAQHKAPTGI